MKKTKFPLLLLTLLGLMMACSLPFPAGPSGEAGHGSFTLSGSETDFEYDGIKIAIRRDEPGEDIPLRFKTLPDPDPPSNEEEGTYTSEIYILEDFPQDFQGTLEIRFPLPQEVLDLKAANPDEYRIQALVGSVADPEQQPKMDIALPFDVDIDQNQGEAILILEADPDRPNFSRRSSLSQDGTYVHDGVIVQISSGWGSTVYAETDHFIFKTNSFRDNSISLHLLAEAEKAFQMIEDMGIDMGKFADDDKFEVFLVPLEEEDGSFDTSWYKWDPYLAINSQKLQRNDDGSISELSNDMRATIAHETFHIAHYVDHKRYNDEFEWLDEATASWFEIYYMEKQYGITDHLSEISKANANFFHYSQYNASQDNKSNIGYGAGIFIDYLVDQYGPDLVKDLFVKGNSVEDLMDSALYDQDTGITYEWTLFLEKLVLLPEELTPAPGEIESKLRKDAILIGEEATEQGSKLTARTNMDSDLSVIDGINDPTGESIQPMKFSFSVTLNELQAYPVVIRNDTKFLPQNPGQLVIEVDAPDYAGVMVFGSNAKTIGTNTQLLAGERNYLTAGDLAGPPTMTISGFGYEGNPRYNRILLLAFNADAPLSGEDPELITITVTYAPSSPYQMVSDSMTVTRHIPEDMCQKMPPGADSCVDDPPCSKNGGSSSGGVITDDMTACLDIPDWCYECDPDYPANQLNYGYDEEIKMTLEMNGAGEIVGMRDWYGPWMYYASGDVPNEPEIEHNTSTGAFRITFPGLFLLDLDRINPNGYLIYEGIIEGDQAKGTWELGYEGAGTFVSAEWTASAER